jgi:uncharacterized damage-inducible protein DinB
VLDSYRELLDLLVKTPTQVRDAATAAGEPPEGEWNAAQVLAHLAAAERMWLGRLNQLMNERDPMFKPGPNPEIAAYGESLMSGTVEGNIEAFNTYRGETVSVLMGLSLRDWERTGTHATRGELSLADVVEDMVDHDAEHLAQLQALA